MHKANMLALHSHQQKAWATSFSPQKMNKRRTVVDQATAQKAEK